MRFLFKLFDYAIALLLGTLLSLALCGVIGPGWGMMPAMFVGMFTGMGLLLLFLPLVGLFSTFFNFMPPAMLIAMLGGMGGGMAVAAGTGFSTLFSTMLLFSATVQLLIDLYNHRLTGELTHVG